MTRLLLFLVLLATPAFSADPSADNERELAAIWEKHLRAFEQVARQHVSGTPADGLPLPKQKNTSLTAFASGNQRPKNPSLSEAPLSATEHTFKINNVWASLTIKVTDNHGSFRILGVCDAPATGWLLKTRGKLEVAKGSLNDQQSFAFTINEPFREDLELTVYVTKDGFTNPAYIPLYQGTKE